MKPNRKSRITDWSRAALASTVVVGLLSSCHHDDPPPPTALDEERGVRTALERSGPVPKVLGNVLERKATALWGATFERGQENLRKRSGEANPLIKVGAIGCFTAGCMVTVWFTDQAAARVFEEKLLVGPESPLRKWPGTIYRGPFIDDDSQGRVRSVRATWALMVEPSRYRELVALSTVPHASAMPDHPTTKNAVSDLRTGEP